MKSLRERIEEARLIIRNNEPDPARVVRKRAPYTWGCKAWLSSFKVGETRECDRRYNWDSVRAIASVMKRTYGVRYICYDKNKVMRVQ